MKLAEVFCDNMVLQAGKPVRIFGTGDGEGAISFLNKTYPVKSADGKFDVMLDKSGVRQAQERAPEYIKDVRVIKSADLCEKSTIHPVDKYPLCKRIFETLYILR